MSADDEANGSPEIERQMPSVPSGTPILQPAIRPTPAIVVGPPMSGEPQIGWEQAPPDQHDRELVRRKWVRFYWLNASPVLAAVLVVPVIVVLESRSVSDAVSRALLVVFVFTFAYGGFLAMIVWTARYANRHADRLPNWFTHYWALPVSAPTFWSGIRWAWADNALRMRRKPPDPERAEWKVDKSKWWNQNLGRKKNL